MAATPTSAATSTPAARSSSTEAITLDAELDIFSGRPNPRWELDEAAVRRLRNAHDLLAPGQAGLAQELPGLGYRGFRYVLDGVAWRAFAGSVAGPGAVLADPQRQVERVLLDELPEELAGLRPRLLREILDL